MADVLHLWTVYESPKDYPGLWVARRWSITPQGAIAAKDVLKADTLHELRMMLPRGLYRMPRNSDDDPVIYETWV